MASGYKVHWSDNAIADLDSIIDYLDRKWTEREVRTFSKALFKRIELIQSRPFLFPSSIHLPIVRRSVLNKQVSIHYSVDEQTRRIELLAIWDNRRDPSMMSG